MIDGAAAPGFVAAECWGRWPVLPPAPRIATSEVEYALTHGSPFALLLRLHEQYQEAIIGAMHAATAIGDDCGLGESTHPGRVIPPIPKPQPPVL